MSERDIMLKNIQTEDFAVYETVLFLDTHPNDQTALSYYKAHRDTVDKLKREFTEKYGPLTIYENNSEKSWNWVNQPWPWEKEAN